jgi:hypothetical protein
MLLLERVEIPEEIKAPVAKIAGKSEMIRESN